MTKERFIEEVARNCGYLTDDEDVLKQIELRAYSALEYINGGGGHITVENMTDYALQCISIGVSDLMNQKDTQFSPGFYAMAAQIALRS